ncbi:MAG: 50S ribosomal protein L10 [Thermodesulfobacteriota bacterium]
MLTRETKQEIINQINDKFKSNPSIFVLEFKGLNVKELENIRKNLKAVSSEIKIVKNTLLKKASEDTDADQLSDLFVGSTAIAFCTDDSSAAAKVFVKSSKDYEQFTIKGGLLEGKKLDVSEIEQISKLPSRIELIAKFAGLLNSPMSGVLYSLQNMQSKFLYALNALKEKKDKEQ